MRLIKARFDGFRLLNGLTFKFSTDPIRNITVVRGANESGKTTLHTALQWALFGDEALPSGYSTLNMDLPDGAFGETTAEVVYEVETEKGTVQRFRLLRTLSDRVGSASRAKSNAELNEITPSGTTPIPNVNAHLAIHIPPELREVFFTDGDAALSFIQGRTAEQQKRVKRAIEQLMGLPLLEDAVDHVKKSERDVRAKADMVAGTAELHELRAELEAIDASLPDLEARYAGTQDEISNLTDLFRKADAELQEALKRGNRDELAKELLAVEKQLAAAEGRIRAGEFAQAALIGNEDFAREMLGGKLKKAGKLLDELRSKGQIPSRTIPVLEDRLHHPECICGESLDLSTTDGLRRRGCIQKLIESSREADAMKSKISDLYFDGRPLFDDRQGAWAKRYADAYAARANEDVLYKELGTSAAELQARLDKVRDNDVQRAREMRDTYLAKLNEKRDEATRLDLSLRTRREQRAELEKKSTTLLAREKKGHQFAAELLAARDIRAILERTLETMKTREVEAVSRRMNEYFRRMIGAAPETALIQRAAISSDFRIVVFGRNDLVLDPSQDLNGASRRALTIAFILALTQVSGVDAPNVIDTPLGMMSGYVKSEVVRVAASVSSQLILFLTHDEIGGIEAILDEKAGEVVTITNPAHYPMILKNDPGTTAAQAILCECDHRHVCEICERNESAVASDAASDEAA